jgi:hypothetical protein
LLIILVEIVKKIKGEPSQPLNGSSNEVHIQKAVYLWYNEQKKGCCDHLGAAATPSDKFTPFSHPGFLISLSLNHAPIESAERH